MEQTKDRKDRKVLILLGILVILVFGILLWKWYTKKESFGKVNDSDATSDYERINDPTYDYANIHAAVLNQADSNVLQPHEYDDIPDSAESTTGYQFDISNPKTFMFRPTTRIVLKSPQLLGVDHLRGDIAITDKNPATGWFQPRFKHDHSGYGYFSTHFANRLRNARTVVANEEMLVV